MALFGFAINFNNGATDYVLASAEDKDKAEKVVMQTLEDCGAEGVESLVYFNAEAVVETQYYGCAILSNQFGAF